MAGKKENFNKRFIDENTQGAKILAKLLQVISTCKIQIKTPKYHVIKTSLAQISESNNTKISTKI